MTEVSTRNTRNARKKTELPFYYLVGVLRFAPEASRAAVPKNKQPYREKRYRHMERSGTFRLFRVLRINLVSLWPAQFKALYFIGSPSYPMRVTSFSISASYYYGFFG